MENLQCWASKSRDLHDLKFDLLLPAVFGLLYKAVNQHRLDGSPFPLSL